MSVRSLVDEKIVLLRNVDVLSPQQIAQESIELSSLWASINIEIVDRKMKYAQRFKELLIEHLTPPKAKIYAEATEEFRAVLEAEAYSKSVQELIRTTKRATSLAENELRESKY